jgi:hypothetical protein
MTKLYETANNYMPEDTTEDRVFYHVTAKRNLRKIKKNGLVPTIGNRSEQVETDEAVFLFTSLEAVEDAMSNWLGDEVDEDEELVLLKVTLPYDFPIGYSPAGYEATVKTTIPPEYITVDNSIEL